MSKRTRQLLKENNESCKQLNAESDNILTDIVVYIRGTNISDYQQELVRRDITQMLLEGEHRGDSVQDVIGEDYKSFCDSVVAEVPKPEFKDKVLSFIGNGCLYLTVLFTIGFCSSLIDVLFGKISWPYFPVTAGNIVTTIVIICSVIGLFNLIVNNSFNHDFFQGKKIRSIIFAILFISIGVGVVLRQTLFFIHAGVAAAGIAVLFLIYKTIDLKVD